MAKPLREIKCLGCGKLHLTTGNHSKYCPECAKEKNRENKKIYYEKQKLFKSSKKTNVAKINKILKEKAEFEAVINIPMSYGRYMGIRSQ